MLNYIIELKKVMDNLPIDIIERVVEILHQARLDNRQVFIMGNGGSASTASHFACDLGKNTRVHGMLDFRVMGLNDNMAMFSALANDHGYENVFVGQLKSHIQIGDIVIGISASGSSRNVIDAVRLANAAGAITIGFTGFNGGELGRIVDVNLHVPSFTIEHVEDVHLMLEHMITKALREREPDQWHLQAIRIQEEANNA